MKRLALIFALVATAGYMGAQNDVKMPVDPKVRVGHLDNGLTYYIRHNEQPKQRCEFHIAQAVGAVLEEDHQNGLAHFLEHMAFNGTQHFPGKGIINYFESVGVNFGGNINAYTSIDETVYRLSDVPTIREGIVDSALLVMHDWACGLLLLDEEIDAERGVIREEWRTGANANRRMWKEGRKQMFPGSQYAKRDIIGDTAVINNFAYQALRDYYHKWYGPDNQAIIVVGDIDVDVIERKIQALWADVPARENRGERPIYSVDDNNEPIVSIVKDAEAQRSMLVVYYKHDALPKETRGSLAHYLHQIVFRLVTNIMSERFDAIAIDPDAPILGGAVYETDLVKQKDALEGIVVAKQGKEREAYDVLLTEMERMRRYGFTASEVERAKQELLTWFEKAYNERDNQKNRTLAQECIRNFLDDEPMPGIEMEFKVVQQFLSTLSPVVLSRAVADLMPETNVILSFQGPEKEGITLPDREEALSKFAAIRHAEIAAPEEEELITDLVDNDPTPGTIVRREKNEAIGTTEWTLSNGVKIAILPTEWKKDEILMKAYSEGGRSLVATEDLPSADLATAMVEYMGLGKFSMTDLQKALSGKQVSTDFNINGYSEQVSGSSTVKDLETMLQLVYLQFTSLRRDEKAFRAVLNMLEQQLQNKEKNHKGIWRDSISMMNSCHSPRTILINEENLKKVVLDKCLAIHRERFANAADFMFLFVGNINPDDPATEKIICQWIGGLPTTDEREQAKDDGVRMPKGKVSNYFMRDMQIRTASNYINYHSYKMPYSLAMDVNMEMIGRILSTRYLESIREKEGGSYGVGCYGVAGRYPVDNVKLIMSFDTDPLKQTKLMKIIHKEVKTIVQRGPLASDLQKEKASMLKDLEEDREKNQWWLNTVLYDYYRYGLNNLTDYQPAVEAITAKTVKATLKRLVKEKNVTEVVMLPE